MSVEIEHQTDQNKRKVLEHTASIEENNTRVEAAIIKNYNDEIQRVLKETGMDEHPEQTLNCMLQQQKDILTLSSKISASQQTCLEISSMYYEIIEKKYKDIEEVFKKRTEHFIWDVVAICKNPETDVCVKELKEEAGLSTNLKGELEELLKEAEFTLFHLKEETERCANASLAVHKKSFSKYIGNFKICLQKLVTITTSSIWNLTIDIPFI